MSKIDIIARTLATLTAGTLILNDVVRVEGVRRVDIKVESNEIVLRVGRGAESYEHLPAGLTFRKIADHALAVASGEAVRPIGDLWTERRYSNLQGEGAARVWGVDRVVGLREEPDTRSRYPAYFLSIVLAWGPRPCHKQ